MILNQSNNNKSGVVDGVDLTCPVFSFSSFNQPYKTQSNKKV
jgi:hypothetical protein